MKAYRFLWLVFCGVLGAVGAAVAMVWSVGVTLLVLVVAASFGVVVALVRFGPDDHTEPLSHRARHMMVRYAILGGVAAVAVTGLGALVGAVSAALLLAVCAGCSPAAIGLYRGRYRDRAGAATSTRDPSRSSHDRAATIETERERPAQSAPAVPAMLAPGLLTDAELCRAWRASFTALQRASSPSERLSIIKARRVYLDELERRSPHGLTAWLASGARAAGDPSRFIVNASDTGRSVIDWDALTRGPDR